jgi:hypothetical protein
MLSKREITDFCERGFVLVPQAIPGDRAQACREAVLSRLGEPGLDRVDQPGYVWIRDCFADGPFSGLWSPRLRESVDCLLGAGAYIPPTSWGWWPISYPGHSPSEHQEPSEGWHIDGDDRHSLDDPTRAVILICLFSDIAPWGGGTFVEIGSHRKVIRHIAKYEALAGAVPHQEVNDFMHGRERGACVEITGAMGDVVLMHPYAWHCRGHNYSSAVRVICNSRCVFGRRLNIRHPGNVLEESIAHALMDPPDGDRFS